MINAGTRWVTKSCHPRFIHSSTCSYFQAYPGLYLCLERTGRVRVPTMTKTGTNDARCVVWPIGMYLFFCNRVLWILTNFFTLFRLYLPHISTGKAGLCCDDQNGACMFFFATVFYGYQHFSLLYLGYICLIIAWGTLGCAAMTKTGSNDARCVVWPIGMYVFFCNRVL